VLKVTNLQELALLRPVPRDRYCISVCLEINKQFWICSSCIPDLELKKKKEKEI
jgi:hypothetical protein